MHSEGYISTNHKYSYPLLEQVADVALPDAGGGHPLVLALVVAHCRHLDSGQWTVDSGQWTVDTGREVKTIRNTHIKAHIIIIICYRIGWK